MEEGKFEYEVLRLVQSGATPYDEFQELIDDKRNHMSRMCNFAAQALLSVGVTIFCMTMIGIKGEDGKDNKEGFYLPVITGILGYWLPNPSFSKATPKKITSSTTTES
jgi:hypothetical protein